MKSAAQTVPSAKPNVVNVMLPAPATRSAVTNEIKISQVGYLPNESKFALVTSTRGNEVLIRRSADDAIVLKLSLSKPVVDPDSGDAVRAIDFSELRERGTYFLEVPNVGASYKFAIGDDVFAHSFRLAMRFFTGQRCGTAVNLGPDFPAYKYAACHTADATFHESSGKSGPLPCTGGWHDAGDYGRYTVNASVATGTLLWAYELNESKLRKVRLDIPESGGALPDMLAEVRGNLRWMLAMQDPADGGVWHKATSAKFPGMVMPPDDDRSILIVGSGEAPYKTTEATADFAAVCAIAARVYRSHDAAFADQSLSAAEHAWQWLSQNPDDHHFAKNPEGISTGGYTDKDAADERLWAAAELFRTTGRAEFNDYFVEHHAKWKPTISPEGAQDWRNVQNFAMFTYAFCGRSTAHPRVVERIRDDTLAAADAIVARMANNGYRSPLRAKDYVWGSNGVVANYGMMLRIANRLSPNPQYANAAQDALHYLLGRNTFNTCFVTQLGSKWPMHPHHRPSVADGIDQPWPGMLVGGPNADGKSPPARQWFDDVESFRTNEVAINWNAPLVFLLAEALPD